MSDDKLRLICEALGLPELAAIRPGQAVRARARGRWRDAVVVEIRGRRLLVSFWLKYPSRKRVQAVPLTDVRVFA